MSPTLPLSARFLRDGVAPKLRSRYGVGGRINDVADINELLGTGLDIRLMTAGWSSDCRTAYLPYLRVSFRLLSHSLSRPITVHGAVRLLTVKLLSRD